MNTTTYTPTTRATKEFSSVWVIIRTVWAFLPLATTLAWLLYAIPNMPIFVIDYILFPMMIVGWVAGVTYRPGKVLKLAGKMVGKLFLLGLKFPFFPADLLVAVIMGCIGASAFVALLAFAPAAVSTVCYFRCE